MSSPMYMNTQEILPKALFSLHIIIVCVCVYEDLKSALAMNQFRKSQNLVSRVDTVSLTHLFSVAVCNYV